MRRIAVETVDTDTVTEVNTPHHGARRLERLQNGARPWYAGPFNDVAVNETNWLFSRDVALL